MNTKSKIVAEQDNVYKFSIYREILVFGVLLLVFIVALKKHFSPLKIFLFSILIYFIYNIHYINSATIEGFANEKKQKERPTPVQSTGKKPVKAQPVKAQPVKAQPVKAQPVKTQPVKTQPVEAQQIPQIVEAQQIPQIVALQQVATQPLPQAVATQPVATQPLPQQVATQPVALQPVALQQFPIQSVQQTVPKCIAEASNNSSFHINDAKILSKLDYANQHINTIQESQYNENNILDSISRKTNILAESELNNKQQFKQLSKEITSIYNSIYSLRELLKSEMTENLFKINNQLYRLITIMEENKNEEISKISRTIINEMNSLKKELRTTNKLYSSIDGSWNNQY